MLRDGLDERNQSWRKVTYGKEDPLEHNAFVIAPGGEGEEAFGIVLANEI